MSLQSNIDRSLFALGLSVALLCSVCLWIGDAGPIPSVYDILARNGIARTEPALIKALSNDDAVVRLAAGHVLALDQHDSAIPALLRAANSGSEAAVNRIQFAFFAAQLGSEEGKSTVFKSCKSDNPDEMAEAASLMILLGRRECQPDVINALQSGTDDDRIRAALRVLPLYITASGGLPQDAIRSVEQALDAKSIDLVILAATILGRADPSTAKLEQVLAANDDPSVRDELERAVQQVRSHQQLKVGRSAH